MDDLMPAWHLGPMAPFDTETSGKYVETDRIVTATVARITPGHETQVNSWLIAVDVDIHPEATAIHGITNEYAAENGKPAAEVLDLVAGDLAAAMNAGVPVVGMNLVFDFTILDRELRRNGLPLLEERLGGPIGPVVDAFVLDKQVDPYRKGSRKLTNLCEQYRVRIDGAHNAEFDAMAAARIAYRIAAWSEASVDELVEVYQGRDRPTQIAKNYEPIRRMSLAELHVAQVGWRAAQCAGLRANFNKRGVEHDGVPGDWPMLPFVESAVLA